ncbi:RidA family protein [Maribacter halichondriae]|uniref:RidA family protein n=1 Tax=Maribacter halichondriae TaxID=2980554 RepID=UPI0023598CAB|nr:RidA family protein [Maribacter sp. Hal144]
MKIPTLVLIVLLCLAFCMMSEKKPKRNATYLETEEFSRLNLPFSQAVIYGNIIYVSGQLAEDGLTEEATLVEGGIGPETRQTMLYIKKILEANGSSIENIIKCTCMLAAIEEWAEMNVEYIKFFPENKPARSAFATNGLLFNARVEIECMAYLND